MNKSKPPTNTELAVVLGPAKTIWDELLSAVAETCGTTIREWKCYSPKSGWALRARRKNRTIIWRAPSQACFNVLFILGDAAMSAARRTKLPQRVLKVIDEAPKYPEGSGVRLQVKSMRELAALKKLALIKLTH